MSQRHTLDGEPVTAVPAELLLHHVGAFTTLVATPVLGGGAVPGWRHHLQRLTDATAHLWGHALDVDRVAVLTRAHLAAISGEPPGEQSVRITVVPASFDPAAPERASGCRVLVSSAPLRPAFETGFAVGTVEHTRLDPQTKSIDLQTQFRLRGQARRAGFDDALFVAGETLLEGTTWSVVAWVDGVATTPVGPVLPSITTRLLADVAAALDHRFEARPMRVAELAGADLVLAVNARTPTRALTRLDDTELRTDAELHARIAAGYAALPREPI